LRKYLENTSFGYYFYISGNGGSAADAPHLAAEFVSKLAKNRAPLAPEALTVSRIICWINFENQRKLK
jgi:D-sedoheptulose 7-phosphate isomerase